MSEKVTASTLTCSMKVIVGKSTAVDPLSLSGFPLEQLNLLFCKFLCVTIIQVVVVDRGVRRSTLLLVILILSILCAHFEVL